MPADEEKKNDDRDPCREEVSKENAGALAAGDADDGPAKQQQAQTEEQNVKALFVKGRFPNFHGVVPLYRHHGFPMAIIIPELYCYRTKAAITLERGQGGGHSGIGVKAGVERLGAGGVDAVVEFHHCFAEFDFHEQFPFI